MRLRGLLIDVGGVLQVGGHPLPGAATALTALRARSVPFRLLSNTSSRSRDTLTKTLVASGLPVRTEDLLTVTTATADYLRCAGGSSLFIVSQDARADLAGLPEAESHPAHVVLGDTESAFSRSVLNRAVGALRGGADLIAMARNRWYATPDGPAIDIGAIVAALEYAAQTRATVIGKPSAAFFRAGACSLGLPPGEVAMVGDDPEADIAGALDCGLRAVWVGEADAWPGALTHRPDRIIGGIAEVLELLPGH